MIKKIFNCISIHSGGGIIYLSMMHSEIDKKGNLIFLDYRAKNDIKPFSKAEVKFFKKNIFRNFFVFKERIKHVTLFKKYLKKTNKKLFFQEYFFNGIPPLLRFSHSSNKVFILFQNRNLFKYLNYWDKELYFKLNFIIYHVLHKLLINLFLRDTDNIIVQTDSMKKIIALAKPKNKILIEDKFWKNLTKNFYRNFLMQTYFKVNEKVLNEISKISKSSIILFYPASFDPHKNHKLLFSCFERISYEISYDLKLMVTVDSKKLPLRLRENKNILFIGNQTFQTIFKLYSFVDYLIFPSLNESLGLPLIEANLLNIPIISSDLDFVHDVCNPFVSFNPYSEEDICEKIIKAISYIK